MRNNARQEWDWSAIVHYMDDDLCGQVNQELAPCSEVEFLARYCELAPEFGDFLWDEFMYDIDDINSIVFTHIDD